MNLLYGTDPEFFAVDSENNVISPAYLEHLGSINYLYSDDEFKHPVYIDKKEFSWMQDGVAFELTSKNPFKNSDELHQLTMDALDSLEEYIYKIPYDSKLTLWRKPVVNIKPEIYLPLLDNFKVYQGFIFGCDKDLDAIDTSYVCETQEVISHEFRYGGGHFHMSGNNNFYNFAIPMVKLLAITVGNFVTANSLYPELDKQRGLTYGRPGRYRPQKYSNGNVGVEYRTPSNSWISFSREQKQEMFELAKLANQFLEDEREDIIEDYLDATISNIINTDVENAKNLLKEIYNA